MEVESFIYSFNQSINHLFVCSFTHLFIHSIIQSIIHLISQSVSQSFIHLFIRLFVCSFIRSFIQSFIHSFIHSFNHSFIHSFIHSSSTSPKNTKVTYHKHANNTHTIHVLLSLRDIHFCWDGRATLHKSNFHLIIMHCFSVIFENITINHILSKNTFLRLHFFADNVA